MKQTLKIALVSLMVAMTAFAQSTQNNTISKDGSAAGSMAAAEAITGKYVAAIGGKAAIEKLSSRVQKGTIEIPSAGITGTIEIHSKAPNKLFNVSNFPGIGEFKQGYDGKAGWSDDRVNGLRDLTGPELVQTRRLADFYGVLRFKETFPKMTVIGKEKIGAADFYVIEGVPPEGDAQKIYFDIQTGLLFRWDFDIHSPQGKVSAEVYFEDYRVVDGVKLPHIIRYDTPAGTYITKIQETKNNVEIDDAKFNKPFSK